MHSCVLLLFLFKTQICFFMYVYPVSRQQPYPRTRNPEPATPVLEKTCPGLGVAHSRVESQPSSRIFQVQYHGLLRRLIFRERVLLLLASPAAVV